MAQSQVACWEGGSDFLEEPNQQTHSVFLHFRLTRVSAQEDKAVYTVATLRGFPLFSQQLLGPRGGSTKGS